MRLKIRPPGHLSDSQWFPDDYAVQSVCARPVNGMPLSAKRSEFDSAQPSSIKTNPSSMHPAEAQPAQRHVPCIWLLGARVPCWSHHACAFGLRRRVDAWIHPGLTTVATTARIPDAMALSLNPMNGKSPEGLRIRFKSAGSGPCPAPRAEERAPGAEHPRIQHGSVAETHSCGCATPSSGSYRSRRPSCPNRRIRSRSSRSAPSGEGSRRDRHPAG